MFVILIQPPASLSDAAPRAPREPPVPPWDLVCLYSYLLSRTGHPCEFFDARIHDHWKSALEQRLPYNTQQVVCVVRARPFEWPAALLVLRTVATLAPNAMRVLCGPLPTALPALCARRPEVDAVIAGDPELSIRALLDHRFTPARLRQIPGLALRDEDTAPVWSQDLAFLPSPAWDRLPWKEYTSFAQGGLRALMRLSRGYSGQPADRAWGGPNEPLRLFPMDRLATTFGKCAHLGVVETMIVDPPGLWTTDRLTAWCQHLMAQRNTHPWSLQLMPHLISPEEGEQLRDAGCRRVELLMPSARADELATYGVRGDVRALRTAIRALVGSGLDVLLRAWLGGPGEDANEPARWRTLLRQLDFPPVRFQPFPLALDSVLARTPGAVASALPDIASWVANVDAQTSSVMAWGGATGYQRAQDQGQDLSRYRRESWAARWSRLWTTWPTGSVIEQRLRAAPETIAD